MPDTLRSAGRSPGAVALIICLMLICSPLVQGGTPRLPTFVLEALFALLALAAVSGRGWPRSDGVGPGLTETALLLFALLAALNLPRVPYYHDAERCFLLIVMYAGTFSVMLRLAGEEPLEAVLSAVKWTALGEAVLALGQALLKGRYQPPGTFDNPNFLAGFLVTGMGIFLAEALGLKKRSPGTRPAATGQPWAILFPAVILAAVILTRSRGGFLSLCLVLWALLASRFGWKASIPVILAAGAFLIFPSPLREKIITYDAYAYSRVGIWTGALRMTADSPLLGVGLGQYQFISPRYAFPVEEHWARFAKVADNPHSEPVMLVAELGLAGLALLILFLWGIGRSLGRDASGHPRGGPRWPALILLGTAAQAAVDFNLHSPPIVLSSLALLAALTSGQPTLPPSGESAPAMPPPGRERGVSQWRLLRWAVLISLPVYILLAARPLLGFHFFLRAGGGPADLLREKDSLERWGEGREEADFGHLDRAIFWDGGSAPYHSAMGSLAVKRYAATGDKRWLNLAFLEIRTAMALNPNNHLYPSHLADLYLSLWRRGEMGPEGRSLARAQLEAALALAPYNVFVRERLGGVLLDSGQAALAVREFRRAKELEPCFLKAGLGLAMAELSLGMTEEARAQGRLLLEADAACREKPAQSGYERSLIDLDLSLVHNFINSLERDPAGEVTRLPDRR